MQETRYNTREKASWLRKFDAHPKTLDEFCIKTSSGAIVSTVATLITIVLLFAEARRFLQPDVSNHLLVDTSTEGPIPVNLDLTMLHVACPLIHVDVVDSTGTTQPSSLVSMVKAPLVYSDKDVPKVLSGGQCGSCYGAESAERPCCFTCDDVVQAYKEKKWKLADRKTIDQCSGQQSGTFGKGGSQGCHVTCKFKINRVAGSFGIGMPHVGAGGFVNTSHTINQLTLGPAIPGLDCPLNGVKRTDVNAPTLHQYFLKVVPTIYHHVKGQATQTNQYSFTSHDKVLPADGGKEHPGITFNYDLSPIMVEVVEAPRSPLRCLSSMCAIVGGVFAMASLVDSALYRLAHARRHMADAKQR